MADKQDKHKEEMKQQIADLENNWKRALADYKNLEKRVAQEREEFVRFSNQVLVSKLLFILDSLELLQKHSNDTGLELIIKEFKQILTEEGLEELETLGEDFDETYMDAVELVFDKNNDKKVIEVLQKCYKFKDKVLRPARVKVGTNEEVEENLEGEN